MKIVLSHSYFLKLDPKEDANNKPYPPLAPLYLSALIKNELGLQTMFYDVMFDKDVKNLQEFIIQQQPDVVIIYDDDFNYLTKMCLENMRMAILKIGQNKLNNTTYIAHGSDASDQAELYLNHGFDYIVHKNAESIILDSLKLLSQKKEIKHLASLSYLKNGNIISNSNSSVQNLVEKIPIANWETIDLEPYRDLWEKNHGYFSLNISTAHGCPYRCNWCAKPLYGRSYNLRPARIIADEFEYIIKHLKADHIWITDDIFGLNPKWLTEFADIIEAKKLAVPYKIQARADLMSPNYVSDLKRSGCNEVWLGAESGSQKILDAMDKDQTIQEITEAVFLLQNAGIKVALFLQYGYPGEKYVDIKETLRMVRELKPDAIGISVSYPLKGTPFYEKVKQEFSDKKNWNYSGDLAVMYEGTYHPDFYRALHKFTHHYFGFISIMRKQKLLKRVRRLAAQSRHIPGMIYYRFKMSRYLTAN